MLNKLVRMGGLDQLEISLNSASVEVEVEAELGDFLPNLFLSL